MRCTDAHNHLHDERWGGRQEELIAACREAGVVRMVVNGSCEADWPDVAALARRHPDLVIPAFGIHPWYVHERSPRWRDAWLRHLDEVPGATVGEIGLDRWILDCPEPARAAVSPDLVGWRAASLDEQEDVFRQQLAVAAERQLPASIHCLQAWGRLHDALRSGPVPARGFLLHSYGGSAELIGPLAGLGARFGFPGYFLHARKARQREVFRRVPADRLLVETDAPDQRLPAEPDWAPELETARRERVWQVREWPGPGGRPLNHPANLPVVLEALAVVRGEPVERLADQVSDAFECLFGSRVSGAA